MQNRERPVDETPLWIALLLVAAGMLLVAIPAWNYTQAVPALGDDASSHSATIATLAQRIVEGRGWWSTDYNLGFPMVLYYQPLPHIISAYVCAALGGQGAAVWTYKFFMAFMILVQPAAMFVGMKRAGASNLQAGFAAALTPCVMNSLKFGYTTYASLKVGLYTQAWGNTMLPLAVGELVALCRGRGRLSTTMLSSAALAGCHMFLAIGIAMPVGMFALIWPWLDGESGKLSRRDRGVWMGRNLALLLVSAAGVGAILSAWFVPLFRTRAVMGGWPFGSDQLRNGYGIEPVVRSLVTGRWMDGNSWVSETLLAARFGEDATRFGDQYVPLLSILALVGLTWMLTRLRREPASVMMLLLFVWSIFGIIGRAPDGWMGWLYDVYPLHRSVEVFRYSSLVQFSGLAAAGVGASAIAFVLQRLGLPTPTHVAVAALLLIQPYVTGYTQLKTGFRTLRQASGFDLNAYDQLVQQIRAQSPEGRLLVGPKTEVRYHYHGGLLTYMTQRPAGQSYGVGLHDSLGFYTLEYFNLQSASHTMAWAELYDFRYVVRKPTHALRGLTGTREIWRTEGDRYMLEEIPVSGHSAMLMREAGIREGSPREERHKIRVWLNGNGPAERTTWVLDIPDMGDSHGLVGAPPNTRDSERLENASPPAGEVLESRAYADEATGRVRLEEPALLVFKHGYHPFWTVLVNGEPRPGVFAYPGFLAVRLEPGEHTVLARYRWPSYTAWLVWLGAAVLAAAATWDMWRQRRRRVA